MWRKSAAIVACTRGTGKGIILSGAEAAKKAKGKQMNELAVSQSVLSSGSILAIRRKIRHTWLNENVVSVKRYDRNVV